MSPDGSIGYVLTCLFCGQTLTVPNLDDSLPIESAFDEDDGELSRTKTARLKPGLNWKPLALIASTILGLVGVAGGVAYKNRMESNRNQQIESRLDQMVISNRSLALRQQVSFWLHKIDPDPIDPLMTDAAKLDQEADAIEADLKTRFGKDLKLLYELDLELGRKLKVMAEATVKLVDGRLKLSYDKMTHECKVTLAQLYADNPIQWPKIVNYDRSTVTGQHQYDDQAILLPAKEKLASAEREAKVIQLYKDRLRKIISKWVATCRTECQAEIVKLEVEFRKH